MAKGQSDKQLQGGDAMQDEDDPFADWRSGNHPATPKAGKEAYTAYDNPVDRRQLRLHLCSRQAEAWEWMPYYDLNRVVHDGPHGTRVALIWSYAVAVLEGRNLQMLDRHLAQEAITELRAFDPARFDLPADKAAPFIDSIEIITEARKAMLDAEAAVHADIKRLN